MKVRNLGFVVNYLLVGGELTKTGKAYALVGLGSELQVDGRVGWSITARRPDLVTLRSSEDGREIYVINPARLERERMKS